MSYDAAESVFEHAGRRIRLETNAQFDALVGAFEAVVPALSDEDALAEVRGGDWAAFVCGLRWEAPSGFVRVWTWRPDALMQHTGGGARSAVWLIAHHGIAARLFRHDPATMLYAPLRIEAHTSSAPGTTLSFEAPGARLAGFGVNKITQAGAELDRALGDLLEEIGLPRPVALRR
ncbi:hypothetical protein SAMN04488591_3286 [Microbacterium azadirachtae]|uniref:DUF302 domain-containing protein n=1 Tax=Microbacterium azadirachtae TaxID=582680 RepID=A0A1I6J3R3_9MICO|nr:hypothetical protein [Microbacterium azadirachtae]SFR73579.1 hypothetical protein SAMN04488591_3286 [Microbacterium azadirachtae]